MPSGKRRMHSVSGRHHMKTANGMKPTFSGRHSQLFIISDLYRLLTDFAEVHTDIARSILKSIRPLLYMYLKRRSPYNKSKHQM